MTTPIPLYYDNCLLSEDDLPNLAAEHKIPFTDLQKACEQIRAKGEVLYSLYPSTTRERLRTFAASITFEPEETLVVDGLKTDQEALPSPLVAHSASESVQSPPAAQAKAKNGNPREYTPPIITIPDEGLAPYTEEELESTDPAPANPRDEVVESASVALESTEPAKLSESDDVTENAAIALMRAMTMDEGHFTITEDGVCVINPTSPPSLAHAYQVLESVMKLEPLGNKIKSKAGWMLGSLTASCENHFGENFNVSQVCELTQKSENTVRQALSVFKKFEHKRYNVSHEHHRQAYHMRVPFEVTCLLLSKAEKYDLSAKNLRDLGSIYQKMEDNTVIQNIRSNEQAMDLIDAYKKIKVNFYAYEDGRLVYLTRTNGSIPDGQLVIDTKNKVFYINGEKGGDIETLRAVKK